MRGTGQTSTRFDLPVLDMGHHYIPKYYLRGFAVGPSIWVYDKQAKRHYQTQVKSTANEKGMYSDELEAFFTEQVEQPANRVLDKLRAHQRPDDAERRALALYLAYFWQRVPRGRERALAQIPGAAEEIRAELVRGLDLAAVQMPEKADRAQSVKDQVSAIIERHKASPSVDIWRESMLLNRSPRMIEAVAGMSWKFAISDALQFLTCDNPVFFYEQEGVGRRQSELSFPISSSLALVASNQRPDVDGTFFHVPPHVVRQVNGRTAHNTQRFAFARNDEPWIMRFLLKEGRSLPRSG